MKHTSSLPIVYSCSGASSAAQMANFIAVKLDRLRIADMSCIAGVGGDVAPLVRTAKSGRPMIVLDGCPLHCAAHILKRHGLQPTKHYDLSKLGAKKRRHEDFEDEQAEALLEKIARETASGQAEPLVDNAHSPKADLPLTEARKLTHADSAETSL